MAEAVGLAVGIFALVGTFSDCVELLSYITAARSFDHHGDLLSTKLDIQKLRLLQWAERVQLLSGEADRILGRDYVRACVQKILKNLHGLLDNTNGLQHRYGLVKANSDSVNRDAAEPVSEQRLEEFITRLEAQLIISNNPSLEKSSGLRKKIAPVLKARWAIHDRMKFANLIADISTLVDGLNTIVPDERDATSNMIFSDLERTYNMRTLNLVLEAARASSTLEQFARTAEKVLVTRARRRIANILWFRCLQDRKTFIEPSHAKTFEWALNRPPDDSWDDLAEWLTSGSSIYWIQGKPGSGKSTLMKYLSSQKKTAALLKSWSEGSVYIGAYFYFWALGTSDQKSLYGLCRSLLHQVLVADAELTQLLLPQMWQEVYRSEDENHPPPSPAELKYAFEELAGMDLGSRKICFFIDGLDEFEGDISSAIGLFERLGRNPDIKLLVSSRPIPACVSAFEAQPQMRLQDLTKGDISIYIRDTIARHGYVSRLDQIHPGSVEMLITDLQEKACGVFLWVILACRSLLQGFASYDRLGDLQRRIDELPRELEDLFQLILRRIDKLYWDQAAKLLLITYWSQRAEPSRPMSALSLSLLEEHDLDLRKITTFRRLSSTERFTQLEMLEGRLLSRCCGLLETKFLRGSENVSISAVQHLDDTECGSVTFMHRTVFEFLNAPGVLELDCFKVQDEDFDAYAVLAGISLHAAWTNHEHQAEVPVSHLNDTFLYASLAAPSADNSILSIIHRFISIMSFTGFDAPVSTEMAFHDEPARTASTLIVAVEAGLLSLLQRLSDLPYIDNTATSCDRSLLYHALRRPYLAPLHICPPASEDTFNLVKLLLANGANAHEVFRFDPADGQTPWETWVYETRPDPELVIDITKVLVQSSLSIPSSFTLAKIGSWVTSNFRDGSMKQREKAAEILEILDKRDCPKAHIEKRKRCGSAPSSSLVSQSRISRGRSRKRGRFS
jgi:hypothetical protein